MEIRRIFATEYSKRIIKKFTTAVAVCSPLLAMYGIKVSTITLLDVAIAVVFALIVLSGQLIGALVIKGYRRWIATTVVLVLLNYLIHFLGYPGITKVSILLRCARFILYLVFVLVLLNPRFFDGRFGLKLFRCVAIFASCYLLTQYILLYGYHYSLPGYIQWLPLMRPELADFTEKLGATYYARPRSIFAEPSQFGIYSTGYLLLSIIYQKRKRDWFEKAVILLGMALSASSTALLGMGVTAIVFMVQLYKRMENKKQFIFAVLGVLGAALLLCVCSSFIRERIIYLLQRLPNSFNNRLGGFLEYGERVKDFNFLQVFFGIGMDLREMNVWYSGFIKILLYFGVLGMGVFLAFVTIGLLTAQPKQRVYMLVFLLLSIFSEILVSNWLILFLPFVLRNLEKCPVDAIMKKWLKKLPFDAALFGKAGYILLAWRRVKQVIYGHAIKGKQKG